MKRITIAFTLFCSASFAATPAEKSAGAALDAWHAAASRADLKVYIDEGMTKNGVFLGTDPSERWNRDEFRKYAEPHFAKNHGWTLKSLKRNLTVNGMVAWFDEDLESKELGPARGTGVLVKSGGKWKVAQYNLSIPIPNDRFEAIRKWIDKPTQ